MVFFDYNAAFYRVWLDGLYYKLYHARIRGNVLRWIMEFTSTRQIRVEAANTESDWYEMYSGVPQGCVFSPTHFLIYINDLDFDVISKLGKFADDTKLGRGVVNEIEANILREDLNTIFQWSTDWQMLFNTDKCTVIHMGKSNKEFEYKLGENVVKKSVQERDLGVLINHNGKFSEQCAIAVKKANTVLGMIKRNIVYKNKDSMVSLYKALVRPRLEFCIQAWSPYLRKDIDMIERVQRRATKLIEGYHNFSYEDRLKKTGLILLEKRRVRGDLIQVFKMLKGFDKVDFRIFFEISSNDKTRGHSFKLVKKGSKGDIRKNFFTQRVVNSWNSLPQVVVDADTINCFKNRLDKFDKYWSNV